MLFLGNVVTGIFWKRHADRIGDLRFRAQVLAGIIRSDRLFTLPTVAVIIATGVLTALLVGLPILGTPWIGSGLALFLLAGLIFATKVGPLQKKLLANAEAGLSGDWDRARYDALSRDWLRWGWVASGLPL